MKTESSENRTEPLVAEILQGASPRQRAPAEDRDAIFAAVHKEWDQLTRRRVRRRRSGLMLLAASVVASLVIVLMRPGPVSQVPRIASIEQTVGSVQIARDGDSGWHAIGKNQGDIAAGDRIRVVDGGVAMRLTNGGSLRIGNDSTLRFVQAGRVELTAGKVYFDSGDEANDANIVISTEWGTVRDIGTQFSVDIARDELGISVRQGAAEWNRVHEKSILASAGERLTVKRSGDLVRTEVARHGPEWAWADQLAPAFDHNNRTAVELLDWFVSQTGYRVVFASLEAEQRAHAAVLSAGRIENADFGQLMLTLETASLIAERDTGNGTIVISIQR